MKTAEKRHSYVVGIRWVGNLGSGSSSYTAYSRNFEVLSAQKPVVPGSSDPAFRGDPQRYNPEEMLVAALSSCHMLWYLHLCATGGIRVVAYEDRPNGIMVEVEAGGGYFESVVLRPEVVISSTSDKSKALEVHEEAHRRCFLANSMNFPIRTDATVRCEELK